MPILSLGMGDARLIRSEEGWVLVDTGIPGSESRYGQVLERRGPSFDDIRPIVVRHARTDHAGSGARVHAPSAAPILAHGDGAELHGAPSEQSLGFISSRGDEGGSPIHHSNGSVDRTTSRKVVNRDGK